jgi:hypothetical protein
MRAEASRMAPRVKQFGRFGCEADIVRWAATHSRIMTNGLVIPMRRREHGLDERRICLCGPRLSLIPKPLGSFAIIFSTASDEH